MHAFPVLLGFVICLVLASCRETQQVSTVATEPKMESVSLSTDPDVSGENAYIHTKAFCDMGLRVTGSPAYEAQLQYIEKHLKAYGWETQRRAFTGAGQPMVNLYATFGGEDQARPLLLSCHIDAKIGVSDTFQAANDGASGAAAMIEIARLLVLKPEQAKRVEMVFFDGEESFAWNMTDEDGLYGSTWDAERRVSVKALPRYQINLDMVGGHRIPIAIPMYDTSTEMYAEYSKAIQKLKLSGVQWTVAATSIMDDHTPFLKRGVESINLIGDFIGSDWWHTDGDNMELISKGKLKDSCRMALQLIEQLLNKK